jgi:hypothetical protein
MAGFWSSPTQLPKAPVLTLPPTPRPTEAANAPQDSNKVLTVPNVSTAVPKPIRVDIFDEESVNAAAQMILAHPTASPANLTQDMDRKNSEDLIRQLEELKSKYAEQAEVIRISSAARKQADEALAAALQQKRETDLNLVRLQSNLSESELSKQKLLDQLKASDRARDQTALELEQLQADKDTARKMEAQLRDEAHASNQALIRAQAQLASMQDRLNNTNNAELLKSAMDRNQEKDVLIADINQELKASKAEIARLHQTINESHQSDLAFVQATVS